MSDQWKAEQVKAIESRIGQMEKQRAEFFGKWQAAQAETEHARGEVEAMDLNLIRVRQELEIAKAA